MSYSVIFYHWYRMSYFVIFYHRYVILCHILSYCVISYKNLKIFNFHLTFYNRGSSKVCHILTSKKIVPPPLLFLHVHIMHLIRCQHNLRYMRRDRFLTKKSCNKIKNTNWNQERCSLHDALFDLVLNNLFMFFYIFEHLLISYYVCWQ